MLFDFLNDVGNYNKRKVARDDYPWGFISTAYVSDGKHPFETAVKHSRYRKNGMVIVEAYDTRELAIEGHTKWTKAMTAKKLPPELRDCFNSEIGQLCRATGEEDIYPLKS